MEKMEKLLGIAVGQYEQGLPLHLSDPKRSAFVVMSEAKFKEMGAGEIQELLRTKHVLISDCADDHGEPISFDEQGMRTLCLPMHEFQVQGACVRALRFASPLSSQIFFIIYRSVD